MCYLRAVGSEKTLHGSGVLIDPNTILTVAHNLFDKKNVSIFGHFEAPGFSVFPGGVQSGISSISVTSESFRYDSAGRWKASVQSQNEPDRESDYAAIILPNNPLGDSARYFSLSFNASESNILKNTVQVAGFPKHKSGQLWFESANVESLDDNFIYQRFGDTVEGMSGCPYYNSDVELIDHLIGIHIGGIRNEPGRDVVRRITVDMALDLQSWLNQ